MAVRKLKPTTPGQRHKVIGAFETITASAPEKSLVFGKTKTGGRNNVGKMTMRYIVGKTEIDSNTLKLFGVYDKDDEPDEELSQTGGGQ